MPDSLRSGGRAGRGRRVSHVRRMRSVVPGRSRACRHVFDRKGVRAFGRRAPGRECSTPANYQPPLTPSETG
jgi:hypothetical protein